VSADSKRGYRGRFAPSPTGPLHFGSLVAAVGSFLDARAQSGAWLLRIEDLDQPREAPGAAATILRTLEAFGLYWDEETVYQNQRIDLYRQALEKLDAAGNTYPCACSRRDIQQLSVAGAKPHVYPGTCRNGLPAGRRARSIRLHTPDVSIHFNDRLHGAVSERLAESCGDFVLQRADGLFAYQLAVVVDDALQGISDVVRGADLLESTARQILLQRLLGLATPRYLHLPVAANQRGEKLSKQTRAPAVGTDRPVETLGRVVRFLGQTPPGELDYATLDEFWQWAIANWDATRLPPGQLIKQH
jgi:glutamyl-Q tRNA(Asp) synthetase